MTWEPECWPMLVCGSSDAIGLSDETIEAEVERRRHARRAGFELPGDSAGQDAG